MNFLLYILLWFVGRVLGNSKGNACRNSTSEDKGNCLTELLCASIGGLNVGVCTSSEVNNICCKILLRVDDEANNASSVILSDIYSSYEERKTNLSFSMRKPVNLDVPLDPQDIADVDSAGNQLNVFQRNYSRKHSQRISTNKHPHNFKQNNYFDNFRLGAKIDSKLYLRNNAQMLVKKYILKPVKTNSTFSQTLTQNPNVSEILQFLQMSDQENLSHNQKLHGSNPEHDGNDSNVSKLSTTQNHDLRNPVQVHATNYFGKPVQTDSTFYLQRPVHIDSSHNIQRQVQTYIKPNHRNIVKDTTTHDQEWPKMLSVDHHLPNPVQIHVTNDLSKPVETENTFYLQRPVQVDSSHDLRKVVKVSNYFDLRRSPTPGHTHQNPDHVHSINILHEPVKTHSTFHSRKPVQVDSSHNLRKAVKVSDSRDLRWPIVEESDHCLRNPAQVHATHDLRKPVQTDSTFYLQKPVQVDSSPNLRKAVKVSDSHDLRWPIIEESDHDLRNPVQVHATHNLRKPVQTDSTFYLQKPVQVDPSHNLRKAVKVSDSHDLRWPVIEESDHDLRNPVQVHATYDLRKPVQTDSTFYPQKPVQIDSSHNLRKAVKVADSQDLRWPTVQKSDHDFRNPVVDLDFFRSENPETKLDKIIQAYAKMTTKDGKNVGNYDPIYELLHEDAQIESNCAHEFWSRNNSTSESRTHLENQNVKESEQNVLFRNSTKACGIPYNESTANLEFSKSNSNLGPWMVSVQEYFFGKFRHKCGGSLLNNLWVITAAHCVDLRPKWDFLLKLGTESNGESQNYIERLVNKISIHPKYNNINFDNDIAILRMELPVTFQLNIVPICLPDINESMEKRKAIVFGWQVATKRKLSSGAAQAEIVPVLTDKECEVMFSETGVNEGIEKNFVCAGTRSVKESCTGDSGGPLAILDNRGRWSLAGLYSWGKTCKVPNQPEVYISVTSYVNWIEDTIACFEHNINLGRTNS